MLANEGRNPQARSENPSAEDIPAYEVYAVNYAGPAVSSLALLLWLRGWDETIERYYFIWCLKRGDEAIVVDCGVAPALAPERKMANYVNPAEVLGRIGVDAASVKTLLLTHIHWDHVSGIELFPNAKVYVQEDEFRFWMHDPVANYPPLTHISDPAGNAYLAGLEGTDRLVLVNGDHKVAPGIELLLAPGHSPALQVVAVNTARGTAIVGSDCGHLARNYREHWPSCFITNMIAWMRSYDKVKGRVSSLELLFPGHDESMLRDYPRVAEGVTRLV